MNRIDKEKFLAQAFQYNPTKFAVRMKQLDRAGITLDNLYSQVLKDKREGRFDYTFDDIFYDTIEGKPVK